MLHPKQIFVLCGMTPFLEYLSDKALPGYVLVKNARTRFASGLGNQVVEMEHAEWSNSLEELEARIPKPSLLQHREAQEMARWRFTEEELKSEAFHYNTFPSALLNESGDREVFGSSYTIFWVVEPDMESCIERILNHFEHTSDQAITAEQLKSVWHATVERIFFRKTDEDSATLHFLYEEMLELLIERIQALPNAPADEAWDALNEEPDWGDA